MYTVKHHASLLSVFAGFLNDTNHCRCLLRLDKRGWMNIWIYIYMMWYDGALAWQPVVLEQKHIAHMSISRKQAKLIKRKQRTESRKCIESVFNKQLELFMYNIHKMWGGGLPGRRRHSLLCPVQTSFRAEHFPQDTAINPHITAIQCLGYFFFCPSVKTCMHATWTRHHLTPISSKQTGNNMHVYISIYSLYIFLEVVLNNINNPLVKYKINRLITLHEASMKEIKNVRVSRRAGSNRLDLGLTWSFCD